MCPRSWPRWPPPTPLIPPSRDYFVGWPAVDREQAEAAFSNQMDLEGQMNEIIEDLDSGDCNPTDLKSALLSAQANIGQLRTYFSHQFRNYPEIYNQHKSESSTTACKVFDIPELLEMILEHLHIIDLLNFYQCSRSIRDTIDASSKLQQHLSLRAAPADSHLRLPLRNLTKYSGNIEDPMSIFGSRIQQVGFSSYEQISHRIPRTFPEETYLEKNERTAEINACFYLHPGQILPHMGTRIRKMFITQPPLEEMSVSLDCCPSYGYAFPSDPPTPVRKVSASGGLTVGDLHDHAEKLLEEHRFCPQAYSGLLEDDGTVRVGVRFMGKMVLQEDDPLYVGFRDNKIKREEEDRKYQKRSAKLEAYCNAKRSANTNGEPIPTLAEFVATHGEDADWQSMAYPNQNWPQPFNFPSYNNTLPGFVPSNSTASTVTVAPAVPAVVAAVAHYGNTTQAGASAQDTAGEGGAESLENADEEILTQ